MLRILLASIRPHRQRVLQQVTTRTAHSSSRLVPIVYPAVCIWGANTGVGKTLISAGLVAAAVRNQVHVQYVKPVQTGYPQDSDSRLVAAAAAHTAGTAAAEQYLHHSSTLFAYSDPVSPHLAAAAEGRLVPDSTLVAGITAQLQQFTSELQRQQQQCGSSSSKGLSVVETAGGVTSPGPSGTLQGDILRPLSLPALLVGDPQLGGISTSLSAYESLLLRGHMPAAVVMMADGRLNNVAAVKQHLRHAAAHRLGQELPVLTLPLCKPPAAAAAAGSSNGAAATSLIDAELASWLAASQGEFDELLQLLQDQHQQRLDWLGSAADDAAAAVWWPFTQHAQLPHREITVVEGRAGEDWLVYKQQQQQHSSNASGSSSGSSSSGSSACLAPLYDAASSWWTQTAATSQLQLEVTRAVAAAAGRYMHVMWPQVSHAPGLALTRALLSGPLGAGWARRVFFSDDGSTAVEVALKMAFRKFMVDHDLLQQQEGAAPTQLEVLALHNAYHGDTHGAMDCAAASPFNGRLQTPWYQGRGCFLAPPYLQLQQGQWSLQAPDWLLQAAGSSSSSTGWAWSSRDEVFDLSSRSSSDLQALYVEHITTAVDAHEAAGSSSSSSSSSSSKRLGALLIEPVLQGAGGMLLVDPLFQAAMVQVARSRRIPVVYDEVFTGCWRLGPPTAGQLLGETPDIACYAKLLTGGVAPLAVTLTTEAVFDAFKGPSKIEALLHGHSYTAYPLGCTAAVASLTILQNPEMNPNMCTPAVPGRCRKDPSSSSSSSSAGSCSCSQPCGELLPLWDEAAAAQLSHHPRVKGVVVLGSVLAVELSPVGPDGAPVGEGGYGSSAAVDVVAALRERGVAARPLGPVVYCMATPTSSSETCAGLMGALGEVLDSEEVWGRPGGDWVII